MDEEVKKIIKEFELISMRRLVFFDTTEERDAYTLAMDDFSNCMAELVELQEEEERQDKLHGKESGLTPEEKINRIWETRMLELNEMDGDAFSFFVNRQIFGDDADD